MRRRLGFLRTGRGRVGTAILALVVAVAVVGPVFAPYKPDAIVGPPGQPPDANFVLGTDYLGHDVLSRVLYGGWSVLYLSLAATVLAYLLGVSIGLVAGYTRNLIDPILMRAMDVILVFPPLLFFLIAVTSFGTGVWVMVIGVALVQMPGVARIVYTATREVSVRGYVEAAVARGERVPAILRREILPNITPTLIANFGLSLTFSVLLIAAANYLNLGLQPPSANWALMISENRPVLSVNVWATIAPAAMIAALTIGVNLVGDAISHMLGRTEVEAEAVGTSAPQPIEPAKLTS